MPKYYSPDDQTLIISSGPTESFFSVDAGQWWSLFLFVMSFSVPIILIGLPMWSGPFAKYGGGVVLIFAIILMYCLTRFEGILYSTVISIERDGTITRSTRVLDSILDTRTFEKGHYRFLIEAKCYSEYIEGGGICHFDAHRISIVDETGRQLTLFVAQKDDKSEKYEEIDEFKKDFFDFTGFLPDVQLGK